MKIRSILEKIDERQLFVPAFQREYVWKKKDAKLLIDSMIKGYPTGTILTWDTNHPPELKGDHVYDSLQGAIKILLDGQQRVTTLYMLIRGELPPYYTLGEITEDTRGLHVNVETQEIEYYQRRMENDPRWLNITDIFKRSVRTRDIIRALESNGREIRREDEDRIDDTFSAIQGILDREFPEQIIPIKASLREAIDIFYIVNAGGVALTDAELALAQISGYWPQAREAFKKKLDALKTKGFIFKLDFIVYALLAILHQGGSDMRKLHSADNNDAIRQVWDALDNKVLDYVANLLRSHAFVDHTDEINSIYAVIPIVAYSHRMNCKLSHTDILKAVKWFYYSQVRRRYASQMPQKLDHDLKIVKESATPFDRLLDVIREERGGNIAITPDEFVGSAIQHPLFGLVRWHLKSRGAKCLTTGVSIHHPMGEKYRLEYDHIFAFAKLRAAGYGQGNRLRYQLAQELTNRAILTQIANRSKGAKETEAYLSGVAQNQPHALRLQLIPEDPELWQIENYELFLKTRRNILADSLNAWLEGLAETHAVAEGISLEDLIAEGENEEVEFKQTLRWDLKQGTVNKELEGVIMKTIAAFTNAHGGTLLIGVADDGEIAGLDSDYKSLSGGNRDKFELHLKNLIINMFGEAFAATKAKLSFHEFDETEICRVEILPANKPTYIKLADKGGAAQDRFYVRNGNSSREMTGDQAITYIRERFV
ncbi:GmrSD restriction endonuclease domain-containing protein [Rhizobium sp. BR 362]|uniref:GmrSD restriction endonuclease domain-containing protein n=1 Tax=Rhizobium sp. BR 362 TaxID=3040670 RepID=UPI002F41C3EB